MMGPGDEGRGGDMVGRGGDMALVAKQSHTGADTLVIERSDRPCSL
jgi:hypothetical protein